MNTYNSNALDNHDPSAHEVPQGMHSRTELLLGSDGLERLQTAKVLIFGLGGVGSWCAEALVRSGVRHITLVDSDCVCITNCNRQLMATSRTVGQVKVEALRTRLLEINPEAHILARQEVYDRTTAETFRMEAYDFIIDAIDSLAEKADLILRATALPRHVTFISSMGAALRTDPFMVRKAEFRKVKGDPLARALRNRFKKQGTFPARKFQCVYSEEPAMRNKGVACSAANDTWGAKKAQINGSLCHITAVFGMAIAGMVVNAVTADTQRTQPL